MPGLTELALGGVAGGAILGLITGSGKGVDVRSGISADMDLLERLPAEQVERRAALQRSIDMRIDDIVAAVDRNREIRRLASSYTGNWRDIIVFICALLFTILWYGENQSRAHWGVVFVVLIILTIIAGAYAARGVLRGIASYLRSRRSATE